MPAEETFQLPLCDARPNSDKPDLERLLDALLHHGQSRHQGVACDSIAANDVDPLTVVGRADMCMKKLLGDARSQGGAELTCYEGQHHVESCDASAAGKAFAIDDK